MSRKTLGMFEVCHIRLNMHYDGGSSLSDHLMEVKNMIYLIMNNYSNSIISKKLVCAQAMYILTL